MNNFLNKVLEKWYLFALWGIASCFICITLVDLAIKPKDEETIALFIGAHHVDVAGLQEDLMDNSPSYLREINIQAYSVSDQYFGMYYNTYGTMKADIVIIPESKIRDDTSETIYAILDEEYLKNYNLSSDYYFINGKYLGIKIFDKETSKNAPLITYMNGEETEDYYAFITCGSVHGGKLNNSEYDTALTILEVIYNYVQTK